MLPGASRAVCPFRDQRTVLCGVLPSSAALWGTLQWPSWSDRSAEESLLDKAALGLGRPWCIKDTPRAEDFCVRKKLRLEVATRSHFHPLFRSPCLRRGFPCCWGLRHGNGVQQTVDELGTASCRTRFLSAEEQDAATPRHEAQARWSHTPQKQSGHPEHPVTPDRSGGVRNGHGIVSARLTWQGAG